MAKDNISDRPQVSDEILKAMICELLDTGNRGATNFYELLRTKVKIAKQRCLKMYPVVEQEWNKARNEVVEGVRAAEQAEAAKNGLLSDLELEAILCQFASNNCKVEEWTAGEVVLRGVTPNESIAAIRTLFTKRGSNAPTKIANTDKEGNNLPPVTNVVIHAPIPLDGE